jgi:membrane-bound lytic murein transglycosylase B
MRKYYYTLSFIVIVSSNSCCPMKSVSIAPEIGYDIVKPTSVSATGTVKIEFADYCPKKEEKEQIIKAKASSLALLDQYLAGTISRDKYNEDQDIVQKVIENLVSQGRGLAQQRPAALRFAESVVSAPANIVTSTVGVVADTATSGLVPKTEKVIVPAPEPGATQAKKDAALVEVSEVSNKQ